MGRSFSYGGGVVVQNPSFIIRREILTRGRVLLHQQCWLWGQDIRNPKGNLLLRFGFERLPPPTDMDASTQYTLQLDKTLVVRLWGFGFAYGTAAQQIYVNRYDFRPRLLECDADRWDPPQDTRLPLAPDSILLQAAARWISSYEQRVSREEGKQYRSTLLTKWKNHDENRLSTADCWSRLADDLCIASAPFAAQPLQLR
jgi:hypothetical protein